MRSHARMQSHEIENLMSTTIRVLENASGTRSGTKNLPNCFFTTTVNRFHINFFAFLKKEEMRSGTHFTQQNVFLLFTVVVIFSPVSPKQVPNVFLPGMRLLEKNGRLLLASIDASTPAARIARWRTHLRGAWLVSINGTQVETVADVSTTLAQHVTSLHPCVLVFSHPETLPDILNKGLPIMCKEDFSQLTHDQLNNRLDLMDNGPTFRRKPLYDIVASGDVNNYTTRVMRLTRGRLLKQDDWTDWQDSEYLQLDQYDSQGMFRDPVLVTPDDAVFHLVWTYNVKALDCR